MNISILIILVKFVINQITFDGATADSVYASNLEDNYIAENALTKGLNYWCSTDTVDESVWNGWFSYNAELKGVRIKWVFAPEQVKLVGSADRKTETTLLNWQKPKYSIKEFEEEYLFAKPVSISELKVYMKGRKNKFFGIMQVIPILTGDEKFMLLSGITSEDIREHCIMVLTNEIRPGGRMSIDECQYGIAAHDGRELFMFTSDSKLKLAISDNLCISFKEMNKLFSLNDCDSYDTIQLNYSGNASLVFSNKNRETMCVVIDGQTQNSTIAITSDFATTESSSTIDTDHLTNNAVDDDSMTYWCSKASDKQDNFNVFFDIKFNNEQNISKIEIDWEYPPLTYSIMKSNDGVTYTTVTENLFNSLNVTLDDLALITTSNLRIMMERPHEVFGLINNKYVYGIRNIKLFTNNYKLSAIKCEQSATRGDASERWFKIYNFNFNQALSDKLLKFKANIKKLLVTINDKQIEFNNVNTNNISETRRRYKLKLDEYRNGSRNNLLNEFVNKPMKKQYTGLTEDDPALACEPNMVGFFYIFCKCSPKHILKLYCYNGKGYSIELVQKADNVDNILHLTCALNGLELATIESSDTVELFKNYFDIILANNTNSSLILGIDQDCMVTKNCNSDYYDLQTQNSIYKYIYKDLYDIGVAYDTVLYRSNSYYTENFDRLSDSSYIVCMHDDKKNYNHIAALICDTTGMSPIIANSPKNSIVKAICPENCGSADIFGSATYSPNSNVCQALIHSSLKLNSNRVFGIGIKGPLREYVASINNYIHSKYDDSATTFSISFDNIDEECPIINEFSAMKQMQNGKSKKVPNEQTNEEFTKQYKEAKQLYEAGNVDVLTSLIKYNPDKFDEVNYNTYKKIQTLIEKLYSIDKNSIVYSRKTILLLINKLISVIKPVENDLKTNLNYNSVKYSLNLLSKKTYSQLNKVYSTVDFLQSNMKIQQRISDQLLQLEFYLDESKSNNNFVIDPENNRIIYSGTKKLKLDKYYDGIAFKTLYPNFVIFDKVNLFDFELFTYISIADSRNSLGLVYNYNSIFNTGYVLQIAGINSKLVDITNTSEVMNTTLFFRINTIKDAAINAINNNFVRANLFSLQDIPILLKIRKGKHQVYINDVLIMEIYDEQYTSGNFGIAISESSVFDIIMLNNIKITRTACVKNTNDVMQIKPQTCNLLISNYLYLGMLQTVNRNNLIITIENSNTYRLKVPDTQQKGRHVQEVYDVLINPKIICYEGIFKFRYKTFTQITPSSYIGLIIINDKHSDYIRIYVALSGLYIQYKNQMPLLVNPALKLNPEWNAWKLMEFNINLDDHLIIVNNAYEVYLDYEIDELNIIGFTYSHIKDLFISHIVAGPEDIISY